jgi:lactate racemase
MKSAVVPILAWYGDETLELDFPESWEVTVCNMKGINAPVLSDKEIRAAFSRHIGSKTIKELVKGKKEVAILFDDLTRPTPSILLVPYIIEQLSEAGIQDKKYALFQHLALMVQWIILLSGKNWAMK